MILALDVHYRAGGAKAVALQFRCWESDAATAVWTKWIEPVAPYEPGAFFRRELPCLLSLLGELPWHQHEAIVIDGYVFLGPGRPGLGAHLHDALQEVVPVIGVAKTAFRDCAEVAVPLLRGSSRNPLWITAVRLPVTDAASCIAQMHGPDRMPLLLTQLDRHTKTL